MTGTTEGLGVRLGIGTALGEGDEVIANRGARDQAQLETAHTQGLLLEQASAQALEREAADAFRVARMGPR